MREEGPARDVYSVYPMLCNVCTIQPFRGILFRSMAQGQWRKAAVLLVFVFFLTESQAAGIHYLCGEHLVQTLLLVCEGKGFYSRPHKGSVQNNSPVHRFAERNRRKIGIVEKCCHQSCSFYDLQSYCMT
ncbi:insulin-like [Pseudophryne corroboree]|uniref:insulin-like n=1 Tax=Pseudophryne corroboree TaxID=495146 RepID=UPI0030818198